MARVALVISDVDGTLVTPEKQVTHLARDAVHRLDAAGLGFTLISARPAQGMAAEVADLKIRLPFAALNGGRLVSPGTGLIEQHCLAPDLARAVLQVLDARGIEVWVFADDDWLLRDAQGPYVARERHTVGFEPVVVTQFEPVLGQIGKLVGVSDDPEQLVRVEAELKTRWGQAATFQRSQPYFLDITHRLANKGDGVRALAGLTGVDLARTAVIGDMFNDLAMFAQAGVSIAMGQAPPAVKARADLVTRPNTEDGFAHAIDQLLRARKVPDR